MKIMVIAPHPDDETLGCGGTLLRHIAEGDEVTWVILTNVSSGLGYSEASVQQRQVEIQNVATMYGFANTIKCDWPTTKLRGLDYGELIGRLSRVFADTRPEMLYLPNRSDVHSDHRVAFEAAIGASKTFNNPFIKKMRMYEVLSETDFSPYLCEAAFVPNVFCDISPYMERKIEIMRIFKGEMKPVPFPRSEENLRALATYRGAMAGVRYAEAFMLLKEIV